MKVTGIIAEYNPFHKGHEYQLKFAKSISDAVIVIMSGSFVQRGDVAIFDKYIRTKIALEHGADLVLELPVVFSLNTAERFAFGGISILNQLNIVDFLLFGSESGNIKELQNATQILENETDEVSNRIKNLLNNGMSYARARESAYSGMIDSSLFSEPNNILALEYLRQLYRTKSPITPITQKRIGCGYHEENLNSDFPSATAIRNSILNDGFLYPLFKKSVVHRLKNLDTVVLYNIRKNKKNAFSDIFDVSEGIENRIINASNSAKNIDELVSLVSTKRYTNSRIRRILLSSLLDLNASLSLQEPDYIRVLGATNIGFSLLKEIKKNSSIDIITKTADYKKANLMFEKDILASDIYDLSSDILQGGGCDFKTSPITGGKYE